METNQNMRRMVVIIPSLKPCHMLLEIISELKKETFENIVLVDDGSGERYREYFQQAQSLYGCHVLTHKSNLGKGSAIKTAMKYVINNQKMQKMDILGIVTVDGDNQHRAPDVKKVCQKMMERNDTVILGCRDFNNKNIPWRSRFGNKMTSRIFYFLCGMKLSDTQTGLRAIPYSLLERMICVGGGEIRI